MNSFWMHAIGELLGTMILIIIGNGVCFSVSHSKMFANQPGKWIVITLAWGLAVFSGVLVAGGLNAPGHLNPAVSIYDAISSKKALPLGFIPFQFVGAMIGQGILDFINWKFIIATAPEDKAATRSAHATTPAFGNVKDKATIFNFSYELVGTLVLLTLIFVIGRGLNDGTATIKGLSPLPVALVIMALGMSLGSATGYALNPARDLGPRIVYWLIKPLIEKRTNVQLVRVNWEYSWVPVIAPCLAGVIIGSFALLA